MMQVCVKCQAKYLPKVLGVMVIETSGEFPIPFRVWRADLLSCPICKAELLSCFGWEPVMERNETGFDEFVEEIRRAGGFILYNPEYLARKIRYETSYVRPYVKKRTVASRSGRSL